MATEIHNLKKLRATLYIGTEIDYDGMKDLAKEAPFIQITKDGLVLAKVDFGVVAHMEEAFNEGNIRFTENFKSNLMFLLGWTIGKRLADLELSCREPLCQLSGNSAPSWELRNSDSE